MFSNIYKSCLQNPFVRPGYSYIFSFIIRGFTPQCCLVRDKLVSFKRGLFIDVFSFISFPPLIRHEKVDTSRPLCDRPLGGSLGKSLTHYSKLGLRTLVVRKSLPDFSSAFVGFLRSFPNKGCGEVPVSKSFFVFHLGWEFGVPKKTL